MRRPVVNGSTEDVVARCQQICGKDNLGLVIECSGANIALKQAIEMLRPNGEVVRVGMGFKPLDFSINDHYRLEQKHHWAYGL
ncbi:putative oxidoreductase, Zn-dependent and NAD(P)-binding protein [Escherichia coli]|uniref:Putative oxidoreductase, Zn-dependent and NAD(P)-binding protein n=1 Tax=Escherichia coli TaxID=562 RepID=A0A376W6E9_ECOLX|nr:putative oxidoreductase, Zn-dependent and NAD(P)-binding protein [Escherichia coli]